MTDNLPPLAYERRRSFITPKRRTHSSLDNIPVLKNPTGELLAATALVIKNIPFQIPNSSFLSFLLQNSLPTPYAFNYHYDSDGAFCGLAFANFENAEQAEAVKAFLDCNESLGRKLSVEYKKLLTHPTERALSVESIKGHEAYPRFMRRLREFMEDGLQEEIGFSSEMSGVERRIIQEVAEELGLLHYSDNGIRVRKADSRKQYIDNVRMMRFGGVGNGVGGGVGRRKSVAVVQSVPKQNGFRKMQVDQSLGERLGAIRRMSEQK